MYTAEVHFGNGYQLVQANPATSEWRQLVELWPDIDVRCRGCKSSAIPVNGNQVAKHFRHHPDSQCIFQYESPEHARLKHQVANTINDLGGWKATVEHRADDGAWIADVLATTLAGTRSVAIEIQLSPQDQQWGNERQQRRTRDGIETLWIVGPKGHGAGDRILRLSSLAEHTVQIAAFSEPKPSQRSNYPCPKPKTMSLDTAIDDYFTKDLVFLDDLDAPLKARDAQRYIKQLRRHSQQCPCYQLRRRSR